MIELININANGPCEYERMTADKRLDRIISINNMLSERAKDGKYKVKYEDLQRVADFIGKLERDEGKS